MVKVMRFSNAINRIHHDVHRQQQIIIIRLLMNWVVQKQFDQGKIQNKIKKNDNDLISK